MKRMKRILAMLLMMTLILSMSGCRFFVQLTDRENAQEFERSETMVEDRPLYDLGNCRQLKGNIEVHLFFVDDEESGWNASAMERFEAEQLTPAFRYLEKQARDWGVDLSFSLKRYSALNGDELYYNGIFPEDLLEEETMPSLLQLVSQGMRYISPRSMVKALDLQSDADSVLCITLLNKKGRCYTNMYQQGVDDQVPEYVTLYSLPTGEDDPGEKGAQASAVAFHILRVYGAENMFTAGKRERMAGNLYPDDIMYWKHGDFTEMTIGDFTAYCIGWTDETPDVCYMPGWWEE